MADIPNDRLVLYLSHAHATGAAAVVPQLCQRLAGQGLLTPEDIEMFRHSALLGYDALREKRDLSDDETAAVEKARQHIENLWQRAVLAAERPEPTGGQ